MIPRPDIATCACGLIYISASNMATIVNVDYIKPITTLTCVYIYIGAVIYKQYDTVFSIWYDANTLETD